MDDQKNLPKGHVHQMVDQKINQNDMSAKRAILKFATRTLRQKGKSTKMPEAHLGQTSPQTNLQNRHARQMVI